MIGYIEGIVVRTGDDSLVVKVDGTGLGLEVAVPARARKAPGQAVQLHTHTHIGSDAAILAGFGSAEELEMYRHLLDVSGVGPRMAVRVLSSHPANRIVQALDDEDPAPFQAVSGIGRKLANRDHPGVAREAGTRARDQAWADRGRRGPRSARGTGLYARRGSARA